MLLLEDATHACYSAHGSWTCESVERRRRETPGRGIAAIGQDARVKAGPASDYELTWAWASAIRTWAPWCGGPTWCTHRELEGFVYFLFEDRVPDDCLTEVPSGVPLTSETMRIDYGIGRPFVERMLETYRPAVI